MRFTKQEWDAKRLEVEAEERALTKLITELSLQRHFLRSAIEGWNEPRGSR